MDNKRLVEITEPVETLYNFRGIVWVKTTDSARPGTTPPTQSPQSPPAPVPAPVTIAQAPVAPITTAQDPIAPIITAQAPQASDHPAPVSVTPPPLSPLRPPAPRIPRSVTPAVVPVADQQTPGSMSPLRVRRDLVAAQDLEFAESVSWEIARTREREAATAERRRQRTERQTNRQNRRLVDVIRAEPDEGPDVVQVVVELPERSIQRRFHILDTCADIHRFIRGSSLLEVRSVRLGTVVLPDASKTLESQGMTAPVRLHAELVTESSSGTDTDDEQPISSLVVRNLSDIRERSSLIRDRLLPPTEVSVRRTHIIEDVLSVYRDEEVIDQVHRQVRFNFVGEPAFDLDGVSRSVFSLFFNTLFDSVYFSGDTELIPQLHHRVLFTGFYEVIGRIISHAFVLVGYFPTRLCRAVAMYILTKQCPTQYVRDSFLRFLPQSESRAIQKLLDSDVLSPIERETLVRCFSHHDGMEMPTSSNIASLLDDVACVALLCKPLLPISQLAIGMRCFPLLWQGIRPCIIDELYSSLQPSADEILQLINVQFCYDEESFPDEHQISLRVVEEQVNSYLQRYISGLSPKSLKLLLMFLTGCDLLVVNRLAVCFNSLEGEQRRPIANTCASQLTLSRFYLAFQDFSTELDFYLHDPRSMIYDSV